MKIGIMTFHWAANYGAVLQAYALQKYLESKGYEACIINYIPYTYAKSFFKCLSTPNPFKIYINILEYYRDKKIEDFRNKNFRRTQKYNSIEELQSDYPKCDVYICGSDQVWNPNFTLKGENKPTFSYFLNFGNEQVVRLSYAASFGCEEYPSELLDDVKSMLLKFKDLSVREKTGQKILQIMGIHDANILCDPSMLLNQNEYLKFTSNHILNDHKVFIYSLHKKQKKIIHISNQLSKQYKIQHVGFKKFPILSVESWLSSFNNSKFVVTNSFHGVIFAIIFQKNFIAVPVEGAWSGMNDRMYTLLENLDLCDRLIVNENISDVQKKLYKSIDWVLVENKISNLRNKTELFFNNNLKKI